MLKYFILFTLFVFVSCKQNRPADVEVEELSHTAEELSQSFSDRIPQINDAFKVNLYELQEKIKINPDDIELRKQFCQSAFSEDKMVMITMGIAKLKNPESGEIINRGMVERAALIDAKRWAMYGSNWLMFNYEPAFKEIQGNYTRNSQVIDKVEVGDSLFLYLASDLSQ